MRNLQRNRVYFQIFPRTAHATSEFPLICLKFPLNIDGRPLQMLLHFIVICCEGGLLVVLNILDSKAFLIQYNVLYIKNRNSIQIPLKSSIEKPVKQRKPIMDDRQSQSLFHSHINFYFCISLSCNDFSTNNHYIAIS